MKITSRNLSLVAFTPQHIETVFEIRNHPTVRNLMRDSRPISLQSHVEWVQKNLLGTNDIQLFIVCENDREIGIALLRNFRDNGAEIGVMIKNPKRHARAAYGASQIIGHYAFEILHLDKLRSNVPVHNQHALDFNMKCGFVPTGENSEEYHLLELSREDARQHKIHSQFLQRFGIKIE